jgi:simple sugar transport system permease protein
MSGRGFLQTLAITLFALLSSLVLFGVFILVLARVSPVQLYTEMYRGSFGSRFAWQNTLTRAAPLILTALCTALPARVGLIIIGGEGALVLGGLAAVSVGLLFQNLPSVGIQVSMALAGMAAGGLAIALVGFLRDRRGVNETISSLLVTYIIGAIPGYGIFNYLVEGPMRDPSSLNKPSTYPIPADAMMGNIAPSLAEFGLDLRGPAPALYACLDVHWGLVLGIVCCVLAYVLMDHTTFGFAARMVGGNVRAAQAAGVPVSRVILVTCLLAGAAAGLAGMVEIDAVQGQANYTLIAGYGFTGILVSFIARHHPLGIIPVALLFGGLSASSGLLQRRLNLPDASVQVLMGIMFVMILLCETLYGRFRLFAPQLPVPAACDEEPKKAPQEALVS